MDSIHGGQVGQKVKVLLWGETDFVEGVDVGTEAVPKILVAGEIIRNSRLMSDVLTERGEPRPLP
jgi:hypothetical protein